MRISTKTGDDGTTGLIGGARIAKDAPRIEAYGTVDELNAALGVVRAQCQDQKLNSSLATIQADLFVLGAELASPRQRVRENTVAPPALHLVEQHVKQLEGWI
ncbi:MAG: ATP:cob(I)alamin adenosyltransferase, partial [Elusimicrobia bacterium]|nr:ATP:cob(I)alamin adenosyltransferase [Elusimicrobiota bacterium]